MKCVVFLPGIMGSELRNSVTGDRIWPPKITQILRKSLDVDELLSEDIEATRPIKDVARFYSVYRSILKDVAACGYEVDGDEKRFIPFAYDWRRPNEVTAQKLSDHLNEQEEFDDIVLLGHSMGGLVLRYLLESGEFDDQPWFEKVSQLITLGTPHNGAAAALKQVAGMAPNTGMTAENVKKLVSDPRYPSAYQLVAPSGSGITLKAALRGHLPEVVDPFDPAIVERYELEPENIAASRNFWAKLDVNKRPETVSYFSFVGSAHTTLFRMDWDGRDLQLVEGKDSGDGTVPIASSLNLSIPHAFSEKGHATIFADRSLRFALYKMLGASPIVTPQSADETIEVGAPDAIGISIDREEYKPQDSMEIGISFTRPRKNPTCVLQILSIDQDSEDGDVLEEIDDPIRVDFDGAEVENARFKISLDLAPGVYELRAAGQVDDPQRTMFMVAEE